MEPKPTPETLIARFCAGFRRRRERLVGLEYELLGLDHDSGRAVPYQGGPRSVQNVLRRLADERGWRVVGGEPVLELARHGSRITLEPGAQLELSGRPHARLVDAERELCSFVREIREVSEELGILWLPLGMHPLTRPEEVTIIPKARYRVMTSYLPTRGELALWMMRATAGMQVNLDVETSEEAARSLRRALRIAPLLTAAFAHSPISEGAVNGWISRRGRVWREVDPERCGFPRASTEKGARIDDYANWALDAPMFFIEREGGLVDTSGLPFRRFIREGFEGHEARPEDWDLHLTTLFPEARLKSYLELRSIDSNRMELTMALGAISAGLFYGDEKVGRELDALTDELSYDELLTFHEACCREGLAAKLPGGGATARELFERLVALADRGLGRWDDDARRYLEPLAAIARSGRSPAHELLEAWTGEWSGSRDAIVALTAQHAHVDSPSGPC